MEECIVGIDWAEDSHQVEVQTGSGQVRCQGRYAADSKGLVELRADLLDYVQAAGQLKIGIEDPSRPVVRMLLEAGMEVWVIPPAKLNATRAAYSEAGAKDDVLDAHIICDELRVHRTLFYQMSARRPVIAALSQYYRAMEAAKEDARRLANRLRSHLMNYFPQFLQLDWNVDDRVMLELLELVDRPDAVKHVDVEQVDKVLGRCRKHTAQEVIEILENQPAPVDARVAISAADVAAQQARRLTSALQAEQHFEDQLVDLLDEISAKQKAGQLPSAASRGPAGLDDQAGLADQTTSAQPTIALSDVDIVRSTRGVGVRCVAGLFAEGFESLVSLDRQLLRRQSIAPVTKQTGKQSSDRHGPKPFVHRRFGRNQYLNDVMHQIGDSLQRQNSHYRGRYVAMKDRGHTHGRACRQLTDQHLRVMFAMLRDRTAYDSALHGATRR